MRDLVTIEELLKIRELVTIGEKLERRCKETGDKMTGVGEVDEAW